MNNHDKISRCKHPKQKDSLRSLVWLDIQYTGPQACCDKWDSYPPQYLEY